MTLILSHSLFDLWYNWDILEKALHMVSTFLLLFDFHTIHLSGSNTFSEEVRKNRRISIWSKELKNSPRYSIHTTMLWSYFNFSFESQFKIHHDEYVRLNKLNQYAFPKLFFPNSFKLHCVKSARIRSYSGPYFPTFRLNTERYRVFLRIQSKCGKIRSRIIPNTNTF